MYSTPQTYYSGISKPVPRAAFGFATISKRYLSTRSKNKIGNHIDFN